MCLLYALTMEGMSTAFFDKGNGVEIFDECPQDHLDLDAHKQVAHGAPKQATSVCWLHALHEEAAVHEGIVDASR